MCINEKLFVMYLKEIFLYLTWPILILVSWWLVRYLLQRYEKSLAEREKATEE